MSKWWSACPPVWRRAFVALSTATLPGCGAMLWFGHVLAA